MSATGSAGVLTFESPWVVNQSARAFRISSCSALSVFPTIRRTSQRLGHKGIREGADTVAHLSDGGFEPFPCGQLFAHSHEGAAGTSARVRAPLSDTTRHSVRPPR